MDQLIQRILSEPFMILVLATCFILSMLGFRSRVRRENAPDYKRPPPQGR